MLVSHWNTIQHHSPEDFDLRLVIYALLRSEIPFILLDVVPVLELLLFTPRLSDTS
jgi:hypothetical protein